MLKVNQYTVKGIKTTDFILPKELEVKEDLNLLAQAIRVYESKIHPGLSKSKSRGEINRTTKKWYRQKGTGRARHGARSAPIFVGGGTAHGPHGIKRNLFLSKNMAKQSLSMVLSLKVKKGKVLVVSSFESLKKTKEAKELIQKVTKGFSDKKINRLSVVFSSKNTGAQKFFRNIKNLDVYLYENLNTRKILFSDVIVFDKAIFEKEKIAKKK